MYQNVTNSKNPNISRKAVTRKPKKKNQGTTRIKIIKINSIIEKLTVTKKRFDTRRRRPKNIVQTTT